MICLALLFAIILIIEIIAFIIFEVCFPFILIWLSIKKIKKWNEEESNKDKDKQD